jgi:integrase
MLDRRFGKVLGAGERARVQVASGTRDEKLWRELNVMLDHFAERQPGLLEEVRDGHLHPLRAYRLWLSGEWLHYTGKVRHARPLIETAEAWAKRTAKLSASTIRDRAAWVSKLRVLAPKDATLDAVVAALSTYREECEAEDTASAFNHARSHARAFLRDVLKSTSDPLYLAVKDLASLEETPKVGRNPQTPASALAIAERLGADAGRTWLDLCRTGMNLKEFYADGWATEYDLDAVAIHGKKRLARERLVPLTIPPAQPRLQRQGFRSVLRRAKVGVTPHDARRSFRVWLAEAGIEKTHRDYYAGHAARSMEQLYTDPGEAMVLIRSWLKEDGPKFRAYLGIAASGLKVESA